MSRAQKIAWSFVIATSAAFLISVIAVGVADRYVGMPKALLGFSFMGLAGLAGFASLFIGKEPGPVTTDERDQLFHRRAAATGFTVAHAFVGLACMTPFFILGPDAAISIAWLPQFFIGAGICHYFVSSVVLLSQIGWTKTEVQS